VQTTLFILGIAYLVIVVAAAQFLRTAPENYAPPGWTPPEPTLTSGVEMTLRDALRTPHWYLLWLMLAINVAAGSAVISVGAPLTQEFTRVGLAVGAVTVCLISLFNGLGRIFWGTLSDRIGRPTTFLALFLLQAAAFMLLPYLNGFVAFLVPVAVIALCFG